MNSLEYNIFKNFMGSLQHYTSVQADKIMMRQTIPQGGEKRRYDTL